VSQVGITFSGAHSAQFPSTPCLTRGLPPRPPSEQALLRYWLDTEYLSDGTLVARAHATPPEGLVGVLIAKAAEAISIEAPPLPVNARLPGPSLPPIAQALGGTHAAAPVGLSGAFGAHLGGVWGKEKDPEVQAREDEDYALALQLAYDEERRGNFHRPPTVVRTPRGRRGRQLFPGLDWLRGALV
jgi:hypothetical protein